MGAAGPGAGAVGRQRWRRALLGKSRRARSEAVRFSLQPRDRGVEGRPVRRGPREARAIPRRRPARGVRRATRAGAPAPGGAEEEGGVIEAVKGLMSNLT